MGGLSFAEFLVVVPVGLFWYYLRFDFRCVLDLDSVVILVVFGLLLLVCLLCVCCVSVLG